MRLHEEYIRRHNLSIPVILYEDSSLVLRSKDRPYLWQILRINWQDGGNHPGGFLFRYQEPRHDGWNARATFNSLRETEKIFWDDYEGYVLDFIRSVKRSRDFEPIHGTQECYFAAWQMFLYVYDTALSRPYGTDEFFKNVEKSLIAEDPQERVAAISKTLSLIKPVVSDSFQALHNQVSSSEWLVELLNE